MKRDLDEIITKEKNSIDERVDLLKSILDYYIDLEIYEYCEPVQTLITEYEQRNFTNKSHFNYSLILKICNTIIKK